MENINKSKSNMQKVALTALAGTSIEWYDFFLYGAAAALIFPTAFFGEATPSTALILSLLTFAAGFIARQGCGGNQDPRWCSCQVGFLLVSINERTELSLPGLKIVDGC